MKTRIFRFIITIIALVMLCGCSQTNSPPTKSQTPEYQSPSPTPPAGVLEEDITLNKGSEFELAGKLTLPENINGQIPAVVLVSGSGPSDMNETVYACAPFADLAYGLSKRGIAVIRFDKRTLTYGDTISKDITDFTVKEEYIDDTLAAVQLLKNDSRIDNNRIYGIGHSLGATILPRVDQAGADFCGMVLMAGTPRELWEVSYDQNMTLVKTYPADQQADIIAKIDAEIAVARSLSKMSDEEAKQVTAFSMPGYYLKDLCSVLPSDLLLQNEKPVLILQGTNDFQISLENDYELFISQLNGRKNTSFKKYEGLNHLFIKQTQSEYNGTAYEYAIPGNVDQTVITDIADWMLDS